MGERQIEVDIQIIGQRAIEEHTIRAPTYSKGEDIRRILTLHHKEPIFF